MPADTVLKMLENNGVKPDELKYTGLSDLLREKGQEKVSPDEVKKFLDANNLQIQEVTRLPVSDEEMSRRIASGEGNVSVKPTRFGSYTLPGGQNYRELSFTLPGFSPELDQFEEPHWGEKAQIGHVRFNDRTGPNGEKLLHLEEMQAYLHQKGRTKGYDTGEFEKANQHFVRWMNENPGQNPSVWREQNPELAGISRKTDMVPDAPFKKTWPEFLMKRMIRYASEHGYDGSFVDTGRRTSGSV